MFENFRQKTKEEKKEVLKTTGKITVGLAGVGALSFILGKALGFKDGVTLILDKINDGMQKQTEDHELKELERMEEEGEA